MNFTKSIFIVFISAELLGVFSFKEAVVDGRLVSTAFAEEKFDESEIRVIRPRYFTKRKRIELGTQLNVVMNQTFIYSYLLSGILGYHFSETIGIEAFGTYGISIDKEDKTILSKDFGINTQILRTQYAAGVNLLWTPIYGKYQKLSGGVIYFDTFISVGAGVTGIEYTYDHCTPVSEYPAEQQADVEAPPSPTTVSYPTFSFGAGQKFYINKRDSIRWDVKNSLFNYALADGSCTPSTPPEGTKLHQNVTMQIGVSRFF